MCDKLVFTVFSVTTCVTTVSGRNSGSTVSGIRRATPSASPRIPGTEICSKKWQTAQSGLRNCCTEIFGNKKKGRSHFNYKYTKKNCHSEPVHNRRGNLPDFQSFLVYLGDCHTSDIGHWFAMTAFFVHFALNETAPFFWFFAIDRQGYPS